MPHGGFLHPQKVVEQFDLKPNMKVAHFGCGHGYFTIPMAKIVGPNGKVYAIDILSEALQAVAAQAKIYKLENIESVRANLELAGSSLLDNNSMDLALLANVLFQSQKKNEIIKEAKRIVKEDGKVIIIDWDPSKSKFGAEPAVSAGQESGQPASLSEALPAGQPASLSEALPAGQPASLSEALPAGWRLTVEEMRQVAETEGLIFEKNLETGEFHYGMAFHK